MNIYAGDLYHPPEVYATLPFLPEILEDGGETSVKKRQEEIDLMAIQDNQALLGQAQK